MSNNSKLNYDFLQQYSTVFADKLLQKAYQEQSHLTGKDILNLSSIKQLNLFVIKAFFTEWQDEVKKLESPLFDYHNKEVRHAMVAFMNVLSQHIKIAPKDLKPYVEKALVDVARLVFDPTEYLEYELGENRATRLGQKQIRPILKYLASYKESFYEFFESVEGESIREALNKAEFYFEDFDTEGSFEDLMYALSAYLVVDANELLVPRFMTKEEIEEEPEDSQEPESSDEPQTELMEDSSDYFGASFEEESKESEEDLNTSDEDEVIVHEKEEVDSKSIPEEESAIEEDWDEEELDQPEDSTEDDEALETIEVISTSTEAEPEEENAPEEIDEEPINELVANESIDVNKVVGEESESYEDNVNSQFEEEHKTLAEEHEGKGVNSVFEAISINHRYMFLQELFDGDNELFTTALKEVDGCSSFDDAVELLVQNYAKEFFWDMNSDEVKELLKVIYRKFRE